MTAVLHRILLLAVTGLLFGCTEPDTTSPFDRFEDDVVADAPRTVLERGDEGEPVGTRAEIRAGLEVHERFARCGRIRVTCVVDGDTIWLNRVKIRVADIDTPELNRPRCPYERRQAILATERLVELLNEGPFEVVAIGKRDEDRWGRKLRVLVRNGRSIGDQLTSEGLARTWTGRREPWC